MKPKTPFPDPPPQPFADENGAKRSKKLPRYDLIDPGFLDGLAETLTEGAERYGEYNWQKGGRDYAVDAANHAFAHLKALTSGDMSEDHVHHLAANVMFLSHFVRRYPDLFKRP